MERTPLEAWIADKIADKIAGKIGARGALTRAGLDTYQLATLRQTLAWARARSPFYRAHLAHAPADLTSLHDLSAFPFTTAGDVRENPLRFVCVSQGEIARVVTLDSSGTTGPPKRLYFTAADQALTIDFFRVGMSTFTMPGDRVSILLPCTRPGSVGDLLAQALTQLSAEGLRHGPVQDSGTTLEALACSRATGLVGTPVQVLALARHAQPPGGLALRFALLTTDHVPRAVASAVEGAWGCSVYNHYGMTEMGLGGGVDCAARRGYHLREADLYVEIVDPGSGTPVPAGQSGEIVFTTLTRRGMPLIRYRTGDVGHFLPGPCPCGTLLRTLAHVTGRFDNILYLQNGNTLALSALHEALFALDAVIDFSAALERDGPQDTLHVRLHFAGGGPRPETGAQEALLALPVVAQAVGEGTLQLEVSVAIGPHVPGAAKRRFNTR